MAFDPPFSPNAGWKLEHSYAQLPTLLHVRVEPTPVRAPQLTILNRPLATSLGLTPDLLAGDAGAEIFSGNRLPPEAWPIAQAYSGHQYGYFTALGDGRAILLGEQITPHGERFDIQLKGSGPTPFSRRGDGRAALGPMLREYIISEAMHALGIPTTRSLAVAATGEEVWRQDGPVPGAVLTRVAASHIRVGTFQCAASRGDEATLRALVEYTLQRHFPERVSTQNPVASLLEGVIERQASLIAHWMLVGFVHGVMNTDNMALSGETIDYGPCAFLDAYDPATAFSSIDERGRYAYANQPAIAQWNLARFGEALLPVLHPVENEALEIAKGALTRFAPQFEQHWLAGMRRKLGLFNEEPDDAALIESLLNVMKKTEADFTLTFASLTNAASTADENPHDDYFSSWRERWRARVRRQPQSVAESERLQRANNPVFIPRNHLVEAALIAAQAGNLAPMEQLLAVLATPFDYGRDAPAYRFAGSTDAGRYRTFCGT